jgi:hypothetical protein
MRAAVAPAAGVPTLPASSIRCRLRVPAATPRAPAACASAPRARLPAGDAAAPAPRAARARSSRQANALRSAPRAAAFSAFSAAAAALPSAAEAEAEVYTALRRIIDPDFNADIVECGFVKELACDVAAGHVSFILELTTPVRWPDDARGARAGRAGNACAWALRAQLTLQPWRVARRRAPSRTSSSARRATTWLSCPGSSRRALSRSCAAGVAAP